MYFSLNESGITADMLLDFTKGTPVNMPQTPITAYGISIDSRTAKKGDAFLALRGENFDGHKFIAAAEKAGCVLAIAEYVPEGCTLPCILVDNTKDALGYIARDYKRMFRTISVAVTGSVGKTTTKQFIYAVLDTKYKTNVTKGNFNNEIGLPLTLFGLNASHEAQLLEMGMNHKGEIAYLSRLAEPNIAVITNIGSAHLENLGSREGIRDAKMEITEGMSRGGILILNADEPLLADVKAEGISKIYIGIENENSLYHAKNIRIFDDHMLFDIRLHDGTVMADVRVNVIGRHNIYNALTASVCGILLGIPEKKIRAGLLNFTPADMRQSITEKDGITIIEDCYNASPESMRAGLDVLCHTAKTKNLRPVAVLGDMRELGEASAAAHYGVGERVAKADIAHLITFGKDAALIAKGAITSGMSKEHITVIEDTEDAEKAAQTVKNMIKTGDAVLFKASRAVAIERIIRLI
ncbi:MAG: UDP-N-acetylmuramoyl-tripeptide--D-alanyl-D-alanine ligase [Clostridia bacterium]|nr:UDP-N-acetylmuramoyl-tripeptide--D-alanyl-D-alanine ligase [Clostridia bacterium]